MNFGVPVVGTIARKKKTLKNLITAIYNVCSLDENINYSKIEYEDIIENAIDKLEPNIRSILSCHNFNNYRWLSLKLLEGNKKIISSFESYLGLKLLGNENIKNSLSEAKALLLKNNIDSSCFKDKIVSCIMYHSEKLSREVTTYNRKDFNYKNKKIDKILTSKLTGIPIMLLFFALIFWITITGANYPSQLLSNFFNLIEGKLVYLFESFNSPDWLIGILIYGMFRTLGWVTSVMLPPMAIFFPLFTILEDLGYLPRIAFNLDGFFRKACTSGKQALTMCMGFGCNAAGVVGARIIDSPRERLIAILTNNFVPCNRKVSIFNYYCFNFY